MEDKIIKILRKPHSYLCRLAREISSRIQTYYVIKKEGRIPFNIEGVACGISSPMIPEYTANLYREVRLLEKAFGSRHFNRSLEIGCGYGRITPWIQRYSNEHYAIDPEPALLSHAIKLYPHCKFYKATAQNLPFPNDYFDLIVSFSVLLHIPLRELPKTIQEIKRVAHPTATIFLHEWVEGKGKYRLWPHSIHEYERMFLPWKLTWSFDRSIPGVGIDRIEGCKVMLFQRVNHPDMGVKA
jgi:SAM-dependent methyltransferase